MKELRHKKRELENDIIRMEKSGTYSDIVEIEDWDAYFSDRRERLEEQLERLQREIPIEDL